MEEKLEMLAEYKILGNELFEPMIITKELKIDPSEVYRKGDPWGNSIRKRQCSAWILSEECFDELDLSILISRLLKVLMPKAEEIKEICAKNNLHTEIGCAVYIDVANSITPILNFSEDIISKIHKLNTSVDIDIILLDSSPLSCERFEANK